MLIALGVHCTVHRHLIIMQYRAINIPRLVNVRKERIDSHQCALPCFIRLFLEPTKIQYNQFIEYISSEIFYSARVRILLAWFGDFCWTEPACLPISHVSAIKDLSKEDHKRCEITRWRKWVTEDDKFLGLLCPSCGHFCASLLGPVQHKLLFIVL